MELKVTAVIVNYNTRALLLECITSLLEHGKLTEKDIIVVDNNSADGSAEDVEKTFPQVILIKSALNLGFGAANNIAIKMVKTAYILMINPDASVLPASIEKLQAFLDETPEASLVGPKTFYPNMAAQDSVYDFPTVKFELLKALSLDSLLDGRALGSTTRVPNSSPNTLCEVGWLRGACILARTNTLQRANGFDERFFLYSE